MGIGELALIGVVVFFFLVVVPMLALTWVRRLKANAEAEVRALGNPRLLDAVAQTAGVYSRGATQSRGNGCLAAFDDDLVFLQWVPHRTLRIPRSTITGVGRINAFLGKWKGRPLLEVRWDGPEGSDSAAWWVADLDAWERELGNNQVTNR